ncbi:ABC transporter substrate-binding protein [Streptomyces sp. NBC_01373]|uniref:ABC transporter substrate-binding protein n=1 Tax=Streptomyces sp. NBC_01373 TaxID=2903843 RepID=UPI00225B7768|nr:ABC transporter substrate-binding protein [Streptomyces sp. NBC_01373]MCX4704282.1 ABC transporter substrate-binding protein [Streptomyces sp. NBC_01373]
MRTRPLHSWTRPNNRTRPHTRAAAALGAAAALLAVTACDSQPTDASSPSAADKTLALSIFGTPNSFDPAQLVEGQQTYVWNSVFDTLLIQDNKGELQPGAAQSWEYSKDARTLTLKLRTGMKFSSGAVVDSAAVKATMEHIRKTPGQGQAALAAVSSVEAPDASTVVVKLRQPDGSLLWSLSSQAGVIGDPKTMTTKAAALNPVGSGPYTLDKKATVNGSVYVLNRREDYWNKELYPFRTVKIRVIADPTAVANALKAGETNVGTVDVSQIGTIKAAGFDVKHVQATAGASLILADRGGSKLKALGDVRVRKAINMAFDREKMVKQLLQGSGRATRQLYNPQGQAYDAALEETYAYDPAGAKKLLAEAGYANGFSVTMPSLFYTKQNEPAITQALGDIGIKVKWEPIPAQQSVSALLSRKYAMFLVVDGLNTTPIETRNFYGPTGFRNVFGSTDPELTKLLQQADKELDPAKAAGIYKEINKFGVENAWQAPLFYIGSDWATKKGITYLGDGSSTFSTVRQFGVAD